MTAEAAYCTTAAGILTLYLEAIRPGLYLPLCAGAILTSYGCYELALHHPAPEGLLVVLLAAACFCVKWLRVRFVAVIFLIRGSDALLKPPLRHRLTIPVSMVIAIATLLLSASAWRARLNKRELIPAPKRTDI